MEQLNQLWPIMCGSEGILAAVTAWRGFLAFVVPLINSKLQAKWTEMIAANPTVPNSIVSKSWWKTLNFWLLVTIGIKLPTEGSMIVHEVKTKGETTIVTNPNSSQSGHVVWEWLVTIGIIALTVWLLSMATGCSTFSTHQKELRNEKEGTVEISTTVKAKTLFDSKSSLTSFKAAQSEKTQGASVGSLVSESNGTNTVEALKSIERILQSVK